MTRWPVISYIMVAMSGFLIPGSASSAYDEDPWIAKLCEVIRDLRRDKRQVVGVCFGHQVIAQALGGKVGRATVIVGFLAARSFDEGFPISHPCSLSLGAAG